jgi:hypothetical protein
VRAATINLLGGLANVVHIYHVTVPKYCVSYVECLRILAQVQVQIRVQRQCQCISMLCVG